MCSTSCFTKKETIITLLTLSDLLLPSWPKMSGKSTSLHLLRFITIKTRTISSGRKMNPALLGPISQSRFLTLKRKRMESKGIVSEANAWSVRKRFQSSASNVLLIFVLRLYAGKLLASSDFILKNILLQNLPTYLNLNNFYNLLFCVGKWFHYLSYHSKGSYSHVFLSVSHN